MSGMRLSGISLDRKLVIGCFVLLGVTVLYPALRLMVQAFLTLRSEAVFSGAGWLALQNTFLISVLSVISAGLFGSLLAVLFTRYTFPGSRCLSALAYLPFSLPPLVGVLGFYYLIGRDGILPRLTESCLGIHGVTLHGAVAILVIHTYSFFVFFYATVSSALQNLDRTQIEAARTLGAGKSRVFIQVVLPMLKPALTSAMLLTFLSSAASFSAPYFFGQDFPVLSVMIYEQRAQFHQDIALSLTLALAFVALLAVVVLRTRRRMWGTGMKGATPRLQPRNGGVAASLLAGVLVAVLLIPHGTIAWLAFTDHRAWHNEIVPTVFTLDNFLTLFRDTETWRPIRNSLWMSALAVLATVSVGLPAAYLSARKRPWGQAVHLLVLVPWALPGTVIAMNLITAFNDPWLPLYNTVWMLPLAYFVRGLPLFVRMTGAAIEPFDATLIEAGRTLGASRFYCLWHIAAPLLAPALIAATALTFVTNLGEFVTSILLYMPSNVPIAVKINMEWRGNVGTAFAYSVLLMALVAGVFLFSRRAVGKPTG